MRRMITGKQAEQIEKNAEELATLNEVVQVGDDEIVIGNNNIIIDSYNDIIINGGLKIGISVMQFELCDEGSDTPICNANWTTLSPSFPSFFNAEGKPVFKNKVNNGYWSPNNATSTGQDILISLSDFNALEPTELGFYSEADDDYYVPYNIDQIIIQSQYGNSLTYIWDEDAHSFVIDSFTPLTGSAIASIRFNIADSSKPAYFEL